MAEEYISREAALDAFADFPYGYRGMACCEIARIPAADVVEVVRCKDCKHLSVRDGALGIYQCAIHGGYPFGDYFCANGERKKVTE